MAQMYFRPTEQLAERLGLSEVSDRVIIGFGNNPESKSKEHHTQADQLTKYLLGSGAFVYLFGREVDVQRLPIGNNSTSLFSSGGNMENQELCKVTQLALSDELGAIEKALLTPNIAYAHAIVGPDVDNSNLLEQSIRTYRGEDNASKKWLDLPSKTRQRAS